MYSKFFKWLVNNNYIEDYKYEVIIEKYKRSITAEQIKEIFNWALNLNSAYCFYEEWENKYKCYFTLDSFINVDTRKLNEKLNIENLTIENLIINKKYNFVSKDLNKNKFAYEFIIGECDVDDD